MLPCRILRHAYYYYHVPMITITTRQIWCVPLGLGFAFREGLARWGCQAMAFRVRSPHGAKRNRRFQYGLLYVVQRPQSMLLSHKGVRTHPAKDSINLPSEHFAQTSAEKFAGTTALVRISIPCSTTVTTNHYSTHYHQGKRSSL